MTVEQDAPRRGLYLAALESRVHQICFTGGSASTVACASHWSMRLICMALTSIWVILHRVGDRAVYSLVAAL